MCSHVEFKWTRSNVLLLLLEPSVCVVDLLFPRDVIETLRGEKNGERNWQQRRPQFAIVKLATLLLLLQNYMHHACARV